MTSIHTLIEERDRFYADLRFNKHRFIDFLGAMAKHYRHPIPAQVGLFFHGRAAGSAYAPAATWKALRTEVRDGARGVPILTGEAGKEELHNLYDMSDTRDPLRQDLQTLLWRYDEARDGDFLKAQLGAQGRDTRDAVMDACRALAKDNADEKERELIALGASYVTLARLGFDAEEEVGLPLILTEYNDVDAEKTLTGIQTIAQQILNPVARHIREEARNHAEGNHFVGGTHPSKAWRKEYDALRTHLTEAEFSSARASILNAHYTPPEVIEGIYEGLAHLGFQGGNVLEPSCGAGRFFEAMPEQMREGSRLIGVEVDALSARIAALAHPDAEIAQQGFERTRFADGSFDLAISNVPFGNEIITGDPKYLGERLRIHDYGGEHPRHGIPDEGGNARSKVWYAICSGL